MPLLKIDRRTPTLNRLVDSTEYAQAILCSHLNALAIPAVFYLLHPRSNQTSTLVTFVPAHTDTKSDPLTFGAMLADAPFLRLLVIFLVLALGVWDSSFI